MFICPNQTEANHLDRITFHGNPLEIVCHIRFLGVIIDDNLSWKHHVDYIITKASRKIGALWRVRRQLSPQARRQFLLGVIQPDFVYCVVAFLTSLPTKEVKRLLATYRRALRATVGAHRFSDCGDIARQLRILPLLQW